MTSRLLLPIVLLVACGGSPKESALPTTAPNPSASAPPRPSGPALTATQANGMLESAWSARGVTPAPACDDATFARRATLDILGTIPTPAELAVLSAGQAPNAAPNMQSRAAFVDKLLEDPRYAEHWATYWDDILMGQARSQQIDREAFHGWLKEAFAKNMRWDQMARALVAATGQNSTHAGKGRRKDMGAPAEASDENDSNAQLNPAVNFALRFQDAPQDLAGNASRIFLGVQIQCAQCHDHKTEAWKMTDFQKFASATLHFQTDVLDKGMKGAKRIVVTDSKRVNNRVAKNPELAAIAKAEPTALDGTALAQAEKTRGALAAWMTKPENPWFAKAFVNRMWGHLMGRGFIDPVDDMRPSNPAEVTPLLDALSQEFVRTGYDIKALIRTMASIRTYHLAASSAAKTDSDNHLWGNYKLVPLGPEELLNALFVATNVSEAGAKAGVRNMPQLRMQLVKNFTTLFDVDEEFDARDFEGSISQALALLNGSLVNIGSRSLEGTSVSRILSQGPTDADAVRNLYLQFLSRQPSSEEVAKAVKYMNDTPVASRDPKKAPKNSLERAAAKDRSPRDAKKEAFEDLAWALLNSSEFAFNH